MKFSLESFCKDVAPARTVNGKPVGRATLVKIKRVAGTTYYVKPC